MSITVIIQGPTRSLEITKKVCTAAESFNCRVIYSTWETEPKANLDFISECKYIELLTSPLPTNSGNQNIRYQMASTLVGLSHCKEDDICIKIRSDLILHNPNLFMNEISNNCFETNKIVTTYNLDRYAIMNDFIVAGLKKDMEVFWQLDDNPSFKYHAEMFLQNRFFGRSSEERIWSKLEKKENIWFQQLKQLVQVSCKAGECTWLKNNKNIIPYIDPNNGIVAWPHLS